MDISESTFIAAAPLLWQQFCTEYHLSKTQESQFALFGSLLINWNKQHNLTAITDIPDIITDHFQDSLSITRFLNLMEYKGIADVGAGGGFPGIPLKIMYPTLPMVLIEVNAKKVGFLNHVITTLGLSNICVSDLDWRTFLRKSNFTLDLFCARASLRPDELIRLFSPSCRYHNARLVYWASAHWRLDDKEQIFFEREEYYHIANKQRKLIFFTRHEKQ